ncbi:MAG: aminoglycoside phosphotransferase family protein [Sporolactobacillus sp.]
MFLDISGSGNWERIESLNKGWSGDQKFYIESAGHEQFLLRLSSIYRLERRRNEYDLLNKCYCDNIVMPRPVDFGICNEGQNVYTLLTWIDGEDASGFLPQLSEKEQYRLGYSAGQMLKLIHHDPAPSELSPWSGTYNRKIDQKIKAYKECGIQLKHADKFIDYIDSNRYLLNKRPQSIQHGDYHCGNMVISRDHKIGIIDFDRLDYGDPWEEFNRMTWNADASEAFASGQINGYFEDQVPQTFFRLMALYIAVNQLSSLPWAIPFGQSQVHVMLDQTRKVLDAYDQYQSRIPKWYRAGKYYASIKR